VHSAREQYECSQTWVAHTILRCSTGSATYGAKPVPPMTRVSCHASLSDLDLWFCSCSNLIVLQVSRSYPATGLTQTSQHGCLSPCRHQQQHSASHGSRQSTRTPARAGSNGPSSLKIGSLCTCWPTSSASTEADTGDRCLLSQLRHRCSVGILQLTRHPGRRAGMCSLCRQTALSGAGGLYCPLALLSLFVCPA
jgi:hypothetical protein